MIRDSPSFTFDSPSDSESEESHPCLLDRLTPLQAERLISSYDAQLAKLAEELRDAEPDSSDACLIAGEIATFRENRIKLVERLLISAPQKRKARVLPADEEDDEDSPCGSQVSTRSARRRAVLDGSQRPIRPVQPPKRADWFRELYHDFMNLWELAPPSGALLRGTKATSASLRQDTEEIGKYLIDRGFPLIGKGSATLVFLLDEHWVAKVARYGWESKRNQLTVKHFQERNRDLMMHATYPTCFAESRLTYVHTTRNEYDPADGAWIRTVVEPHRLYVQERLYGPFTYEGLDEEQIDSQVDNADVLREFIRNHPDPNPASRSSTILKQWAYTKKGVLVCFDYI